MSEPYSGAADVGEEEPLTFAGMTPREALGAIRRRRWLVLAVTTLVLLVGLWRTLREPRIYHAAATVRISQARSAITNAPTYQSYDPRTDPLLSEQQVIRSQTVAEAVVDRLGLRVVVTAPRGLTRDDLFGGRWPVVDSLARSGSYVLTLKPATYALSAGSAALGEARYGAPLSGGGLTIQLDHRPDVEDGRVLLTVVPRASAALGVRAGIATKVVPQTNIVEISYDGTEPWLVRDVANAIAEEYRAFSSTRQRDAARAKSRYTKAAVDSQAVALARAQEALKVFKQANKIGDVMSERGALEAGIHRLEDERQAADVERKVYGALLGKLARADTVDEELRRLTGTDAVGRNSYLSNLFDRWFDLEKTLQQLRTTRNERHPDVQAQLRLISRTKEDLQSASGQYLQGLNTRIASMDGKIADLRTQLERFPPLEAEQIRLQSNVETQNRLYADLLSSYQVSRISESDDGGTVQLLDVAQRPQFAISPNRRRAATYALVVGLLLGVGLALLLERLDDTVKSPNELREKMDLTLLGLIPKIDTSEPGAGEASPAAGRLVTHADPRSPVAEAYRSLRTNLAFARTTQQVQTMVVASPGPGDGKSTTAANLAISFAQQGQRTLLVDADMRRAVLDRTFDLARQPGLTDVIVGAAPLEGAARATQVPNLWVLPSGQFPPNPSELLGSPTMREVLRAAKERYDVVLFDSPPLLAVTDAAVLSTLVDGTILVVRTASTHREAMRRALAQLRTVHGRLLGAVLNDVDLRGGAYYGGYGYYYANGAESGNGTGRADGFMGRLRRLAGRTGVGP